jgi:hypothetical protein
MGINKHFIRWYNGELTIKERKERDKYQLIKDLTPKEMEECKENEYNFLKKIKGEDSITAIKVLKIGKVWKILIYLANEITIEKVFTRALEQDVAWSFWQFKRLFKEKKEGDGSKEKNLLNNKDIKGEGMKFDGKEIEKAQIPPPDLGSKVSYILETPPQRIFPKLTSIAQYQKNKSVSFQLNKKEEEISEQEVVDTVEKYRKGLLKIKEEKEAKRMSPGSSTLKKDNVLPLEVVKIINEQKKKDKEIKFYQKLSWPLKQVTMKGKIDECLSPKIKELKAIFKENEMSMEWKKIADEVVVQEMEEQGVSDKVEMKYYLDKASGDYTDWLKYHVQ